MRSFTLQLRDATQGESIPGVISFIGEDSSGSFGVKPGHARMMASLCFGLASFRMLSGDWRYLALPGALLYFHDDTLALSTRHYLIDDDYRRISRLLREKLLAEEAALSGVRESLQRMEEAALHRLWRLGRGGSGYDGP